MDGTAAQTLEVVDPVNYVAVTNNSTVTFTQPFTIRNTLTLSGTGTTLNINNDLTISGTTAVFTIPSGVTVNVGTGVTLTAADGITVNGTLTVADGAKVLIGSGKTLNVAAGGTLQLNGSSGNPATLDSVSGTYTFTMAGSISADYFAIDHTAATGMNVTGTVTTLQNGDFHYIASAGVAVTVGAAASLPATMPSLGFYDDSSFGNNFNFNVNAAYAGTAAFLDLYAGGVGGAAKEKADANNKINWGSLAGTTITLTDGTAAGSPPATIAASSAATLFSTFSFNLNQSDLFTDLSQVTLTMYGTASASDIAYVQVFKDSAGGTNCKYDAGIDTQVGSNLTLSGSPPTATVTFSAGDVRTSGSTAACFHVLVATSATAQAGNKIGIGIENTTDVTNSRSGGGSYSFGATSSPPVETGLSTISGTVSRWDGPSSVTWTATANWTPATVPSSAQDCIVGSGVRIPAPSQTKSAGTRRCSREAL